MIARTRRILATALLAVCVVGSGVVYQAGAPRRAEESLRSASLEQLQERARANSGNARVLYYLGRKLQEAGRPDEAASTLAQAASGSTDEDIYLAWAATMPDEQAGTTLLSFLSFHPESAAAHRALAQIFFRRGNYANSFEQIKTAINLGAQDVESWQLLGVSAFETAKYDEAEKAYRKAAALEPKNSRYLVGLAGVLLKQEQTAQAKQLLEKAVAVAPQDEVAWIALGQVQMDAAQTPAELDAAKVSLEKAITLRPDRKVAQLYLAQCLIKAKRWQEALTALQQTQPELADEPAVFFAQSQAFRGVGDTRQAERALERHKNLRDFQAARQSLLARTGTDLKNNTTVELAKIAQQYGAYRTAVEQYRKALQDSPNDPDLVRALASAERQASSQ